MKILVHSLLTALLVSCTGPTRRVVPIVPDRDIVLINIQNGDRAFISKILSKIDSIGPRAVGIDVYFKSPKTAASDSLLYNTLKRLKGDILTISFDSRVQEVRSIPLFTSAVDGEGFLNLEEVSGEVSHMRAIKNVGGKMYEFFALKVLKLWKPDLDFSSLDRKSIPIEYSRTLNSFLMVNGNDLISLPVTAIDIDKLRSKLFLVGFTGPGDEDMYRTPLRFLHNDSMADDQPDTYGLVIIANQIHTLLEKVSK